MTKRELNKKLKSKTLEIRNAVGIKDGIIRVIRARQKDGCTNIGSWRPTQTEVDIQVYAQVQNTDGDYEPINHYGPKEIRNFLRRRDSKVTDTVANWIKLWGFNTNIKINTIKLIPRKWQIINLP